MTNIYAKFSTDKELEAGGGYALALDGGGTIFVRRAGGENLHFAKVYNLAMAPYAADQEAGTLDEQTMRRVLAGVYAEAIIVGWENILDEDDEPIEFNTKNVIRVLLDLNDLFVKIRDASAKFENFQRSRTKAAAKNSPGGLALKSVAGRKRN